MSRPRQTSGMMAEMLNQDFAFKALERMPQQKRAGIRVPKVYRVIEKAQIVYIVMEYVNGKTLKESLEEGISHDKLQDYYNQIAKAIELFISIKVPDGVTPGPVGGGIIKHPLFKDTIASIEYTSFDDLQQHVNNVANLPETNNLKIDFREEDICFCFSDLYEGNFIFTDEDDLYILDFHHAGFLPVSFMTYAFDQPRPVCEAIKGKFVLPQENLPAMRVAGHNFMIRWRKAGKYFVIMV
ncbi:hypothetical protein B0J14DRAFT_29184 [Halenospora varia]|nr:hypothetical protein B0J14DRAFT_29184 [Halenospora varia]